MAYFWVGGTGTWDGAAVLDWSSSSGGIPNQVTPPGSSDAVTFDGSSGGGTATVNTGFSIVSLTSGAYTGTLDFSANNNSPTMQTFNGSGTGTRTLNMGSGTWTITGNAGTIWTFATATNLTCTGTNSVNFTYSGSTGTRTIIGSSAARTGAFNITAGSDALSMNNNYCTDLNFTGYTGTMTMVTNNPNIAGSLTWGTGMTVATTGITPQLTATSGTPIIRSNGVQANCPITIIATTGVTYQLFDNLDLSGASNRQFQLTSGNLDANNKNVTCGSFASSNSNTRVLTMGSGTWTLTGNATTIWNTSTSTNLTNNVGTSTIICNYSGSTGTRTFTPSTSVPVGNLKVTAGTDIFSFTGGCADFDTTGFTGTLSNQNSSITSSGSIILGTGMTVTGGTGTVNLIATSGTKSWTSNSVVFDRPITFNGVGGTFQFADTFIGGATRTYTLTNGTLNGNNQNISIGSFSSSNANIRTLSLGSGTWTLTGTGTVWNITTATGMTFNAGTSTIVANDASSSSKTFAFNAMTYNNLRLSGAGTGVFILGVSTVTTTFNRITVDTAPHTVQVFAGKTIAASSLVWSGVVGSLNTFRSTTDGSQWNISVASGVVALDYIALKDSDATGGAKFYAGSHSVDMGGNSGWIFTDPPYDSGAFLAFF